MCVCVCVCVCVYPGYVQSPGWDGRTLLHFGNLVGKNVTVKVPPQHKVMLSFKDVHMRGKAADSCHCAPWGVQVGESANRTQKSISACEFILLSPALRDFDEIVVLVHRTTFILEKCKFSITGESVNVSYLIVFHLTMIGTGILFRNQRVVNGDGENN